MALQTPVVTLATHVTEKQKSLYSLSFRMVAADDDAEYDGLDVTYSINWRPGDAAADKVIAARAYFQELIDSYKAAKVIEEHPTMGVAVAAIQTGLVI